MERLAITLDGARAAMQAAWREKRLGYQVGASNCTLRYFDPAGNVIGCCAAGAFIPDSLVGDYNLTAPRATDLTQIPNRSGVKEYRHLFDAPDDDWEFVLKAQELHDLATNWRKYDEELAAIARADFERHIGVLAEAVAA
jgi:hypothetical protein